MKLINWTKRKLWLHMPLWICVSLAIVVTLLLPEQTAESIVLFLFFGYFLCRYLWRRYLKKHDQLGDDSSGMFSLVFWGFLAAAYIYATFTPDSPELVMYETATPNVYVTEDQELSRIPLTRKAKKGAMVRGLERYVKMKKDHAFTCAVILKDYYLENCVKTQSQVARVELDNDPSTIEILMSKKYSKECADTPCKAWLIQTTEAEIDSFNDMLLESEESELPLPTAKATVLTQWEGIIVPIIVLRESTDGWRHVEVTDALGNKVAWKK